jgi:hypothetical protein
LIVVSQRTIRSSLLLIPGPVSRGLRLAAAVLVLIGSGSASTPSTALPESVGRCVPCHRSGEMDQLGEWLASPYSASEGGLGCVDCHPKECRGSSGRTAFGRTTSAVNLESLRRAVRLALTTTWNGNAVEAEVAVTNVGAGHHLPTGSAGRLVLEVAARDRGAEPLALTPKMPARAIRLAPFATDVSHYHFAAPEEGPVDVTARLLLVPAAGDPIDIANTTTVCRSPARSR